ncbi:hypothetical protein B4168_4003 [Anoxybacillus flavithermus]|nr:hypothetical protein B4168_4003 [Anoxybacillus flavithermus]OAO87618.1 hypothetical protein GT23_1267 [Parageobacillus thermoglucosidasius]
MLKQIPPSFANTSLAAYLPFLSYHTSIGNGSKRSSIISANRLRSLENIICFGSSFYLQFQSLSSNNT